MSERRCEGCKCKAVGPLRLTRTLDDRNVVRLCRYCLEDMEDERSKSQKGAA